MIVVPRAARLLRHLAAQEVTRYALRYVCFRRIGEDCYAMASDGKRAAVLRWKDKDYNVPGWAGTTKNEGDVQILLPIEILAKIPGKPRNRSGDEDIFIVARSVIDSRSFYGARAVWMDGQDRFRVTAQVDHNWHFPDTSIDALLKDPWKAWDDEAVAMNLELHQQALKVSLDIMKGLLGAYKGTPFKLSLYRPDGMGHGKTPGGLKVHRLVKAKDQWEQEFEYTLIQMGLSEIA